MTKYQGYVSREVVFRMVRIPRWCFAVERSVKIVDLSEICRFPVKQICFSMGSPLRSRSFVCFSVDLCLNPQEISRFPLLRSTDFNQICGVHEIQWIQAWKSVDIIEIKNIIGTSKIDHWLISYQQLKKPLITETRKGI